MEHQENQKTELLQKEREELVDIVIGLQSEVNMYKTLYETYLKENDIRKRQMKALRWLIESYDISI